jgi:hypothetical protein
MDSQQDQQKQAYQEALERGEAFEELIRTRGWGYIKAWYQNKIQRLASSLLLDEKEPMETFENDRRELIGLRKIIGMIDSDIQTLHDKIDKDKHDKADRPTEK